MWDDSVPVNNRDDNSISVNPTIRSAITNTTAGRLYCLTENGEEIIGKL